MKVFKGYNVQIGFLLMIIVGFMKILNLYFELSIVLFIAALWFFIYGEMWDK